MTLDTCDGCGARTLIREVEGVIGEFCEACIRDFDLESEESDGD